MYTLIVSENRIDNVQVIYKLLSMRYSFFDSKNAKYTNSDDIKLYKYKDHYIFNIVKKLTSENLVSLIDKCKLICGEQAQSDIQDINLVYVFNSSSNNDRKNITRIYTIISHITSITINYFVIDLNGSTINISGIQILQSIEELRQMILSNTNAIKINKNIDSDTEKIITLVGETGVGKTTIVNYVIGSDIYKVAQTRHTTQELLPTYVYLNNTKIKLLDTYGLDNALQSTISDINKVINKTFRVIFVVDVFNYNRKINEYIFNRLNNSEVNYSIILNKCNLIDDKAELSNIQQSLRNKFLKNIYTIQEINSTSIRNTVSNIVAISKNIDISDDFCEVVRNKFCKLKTIIYCEDDSDFYKFMYEVRTSYTVNSSYLEMIRRFIVKSLYITEHKIIFLKTIRNNAARLKQRRVQQNNR